MVAISVLKTRALLSLWRRGTTLPSLSDWLYCELKTGWRGALWRQNGLIAKHNGRVFVQPIYPCALKPCDTQHTRLIFGVFCMDWCSLSITRLSILWVKQGGKWHPILLRNPRQRAGRVALHLCLRWQHMGDACMCMGVKCVCVCRGGGEGRGGGRVQCTCFVFRLWAYLKK